MLRLVQSTLGSPDDTLHALGKVEWRILGCLLHLVLGLAGELLQPGLGLVGLLLDSLPELLGPFVDLLRRRVLADDVVLGLVRLVLYLRRDLGSLLPDLANRPLDLFRPGLRPGARDGLPCSDGLPAHVVPVVVVCIVRHRLAARHVLGEEVAVRVRLGADVAGQRVEAGDTERGVDEHPAEAAGPAGRGPRHGGRAGDGGRLGVGDGRPRVDDAGGGRRVRQEARGGGRRRGGSREELRGVSGGRAGGGD